MTASETTCRELLQRARDGDRDAAGELLQHHRPYLKFLTLRMIGQNLATRLDDSDIVQQTCMSVLGRIQDFAGQGTDEFVAWLRTIHERNVKNALRDNVAAQKRSIQREQSIDGECRVQLAVEQSSPSQRLLQGEQAVRLAAALQTLPRDQREAVRLRYLEGWSLEQIAKHTGRTKHSIAGLVKRGLIGLRKVLRNDQ